jgi:hypothetical protein
MVWLGFWFGYFVRRFPMVLVGIFFGTLLLVVGINTYARISGHQIGLRPNGVSEAGRQRVHQKVQPVFRFAPPTKPAATISAAQSN